MPDEHTWTASSLQARATYETASSKTSEPSTTSTSFRQIVHIDPSSTGTAVAQIADIPWIDFANASLKALCQSGDCVKDCQNYSRLFETIPSGITENATAYGLMLEDTVPDVTLFGLCTNLAQIYGDMSISGTAGWDESFFPMSRQNETGRVSSTVASCLSTTCQISREAKDCASNCSMADMYSGGAAINIAAVNGCLQQLCCQDCDIVYVDQDIMGIGVLSAYIIQIVLVVVAAIFPIHLAIRKLYRRARRRTLPQKELGEDHQKDIKCLLEGFLAAQCYSTISIGVAALCSHPGRVDPLTGSALQLATSVGLLCSTLMLMLLHSFGCRSWYSTLLSTTTYAFASAVFWRLASNLSQYASFGTSDPALAVTSDKILRQIYQVGDCGHSSAIALCKQTTGKDPLEFLETTLVLQGYAVPATIWTVSTLGLFLLVADQLANQFGHTLWGSSKTRGRRRESRIQSMWFTTRDTLESIYFLAVADILLTIGIASQGTLLLKYWHAVIHSSNRWAFGQIVAIVMWTQPIVDLVRLPIKRYWVGKASGQAYESLPNRQSNSSATSMQYGESDFSLFKVEAKHDQGHLRLDSLTASLTTSLTPDLEDIDISPTNVRTTSRLNNVHFLPEQLPPSVLNGNSRLTNARTF